MTSSQQWIVTTWHVFCRFAPKVYRGKQGLFVGSHKLKKRAVDGILVEFQGFMVIEDGIMRILHSNLN
jgi:hypothetical protein